MDSNSITSILPIITMRIDTYVGISIYITGVMGAIGNIIVYRSKTMRNRACSIYLLWQSIIDLFYLTIVLLTNILMRDFQVPITSRHDALCKIRQFCSVYGNQLAVIFLSLATIDRILLSQRSQFYRQWGNRTSLAKKMVAAAFPIWAVVACHRLIWYRTSNGVCAAQPGTYKYFDNFFEATMTTLIPTIVLTTLAIIIGRSVRHIVQRHVVPMLNINQLVQSNSSVINKINSQLTMMLFLQTFLSIISFVPYSANAWYANITFTWSKSSTRLVWEALISNIIRLLSYLFYSCPFYVSFFTFSSFRKQFLRSLGFRKQNNDFMLDTIQTMVPRNAPTNMNIRIA